MMTYSPWDSAKKKITEAKIGVALTSVKFEVNATSYTVLRLLGEGGYSQVYEVYNAEKDTFALKIVNLKTDCSAEMKGELIREILFLEKLKNFKHVVRAFEYEIKETAEENKVFLLMEKGEKDLMQLLSTHKQEKSLTPVRLKYYWEQMLTAVQEVHEAKIIHADIKPANFLLVSGELKIIDFGMACEMPPGQDHVVRHFISGTRDYMSPEAYAGLARDVDDWESETSIKVTTKIDVWALGIFLYQTIFNGTLPFAEVWNKQNKTNKVISTFHTQY